MTPYYNHFYKNTFGKNEFLTIPENQMQSFKIIVESGNENIIVNQDDIPTFIIGIILESSEWRQKTVIRKVKAMRI